MSNKFLQAERKYFVAYLSNFPNTKSTLKQYTNTAKKKKSSPCYMHCNYSNRIMILLLVINNFS